MITLVLEASTYAGSTALLDGHVLLGEREVAMRGKEHEALMPAVAELLSACGRAPRDVARVVCGAGPGSFTSLRIAGSIAKGMALAAGATLVPVSSLALLVASREPRLPGLFLATGDAMRGESYVQLFECDDADDLRAIGAPGLVATARVELLAAETGSIALGPGRLDRERAVPRAGSAVYITKLINRCEAADLAAWEPRYGRLAEAQVKWEAEHGRPLQGR